MSIDNLRRDIVAIAISRGNTSIDHLEDIARDLLGLSDYIYTISHQFDQEEDDPINSWTDGDPF